MKKQIGFAIAGLVLVLSVAFALVNFSGFVFASDGVTIEKTWDCDDGLTCKWDWCGDGFEMYAGNSLKKWLNLSFEADEGKYSCVVKITESEYGYHDHDGSAPQTRENVDVYLNDEHIGLTIDGACNDPKCDYGCSCSSCKIQETEFNFEIDLAEENKLSLEGHQSHMVRAVDVDCEKIEEQVCDDGDTRNYLAVNYCSGLDLFKNESEEVCESNVWNSVFENNFIEDCSNDTVVVGNYFCDGKDKTREIVNYEGVCGVLGCGVLSNVKIEIEECEHDCVDGSCVDECVGGEFAQRQIGNSDTGICEYGLEKKTCDDGDWTDWYVVEQPVGPQVEVCNQLDDDCDGQVDEGLDCDIECDVDADCGTPGCAGGLNYCVGNDVFQVYNFYGCVNPGTVESYCRTWTAPQLLFSCEDYGRVCDPATAFCILTGGDEENITAPVVKILSPVENATYDEEVLLNATSNQDILFWHYELDGSANWVNFSLGDFLTDLSNGVHYLNVSGMNENGTGYDSVSFYFNNSEEDQGDGDTDDDDHYNDNDDDPDGDGDDVDDCIGSSGANYNDDGMIFMDLNGHNDSIVLGSAKNNYFVEKSNSLWFYLILILGILIILILIFLVLVRR